MQYLHSCPPTRKSVISPKHPSSLTYLYSDVPQRYLFALESYVRTKRDVFSQALPIQESEMRGYQVKYVGNLVRQTPSLISTQSNPIAHVRRPENGIIASPPARQGPFTFSPRPAEFEDSDGDACDITYVLHGYDGLEHEDDLPWNQGLNASPGRSNKEHLGAILVSYSDGRIDVILDLEKIEARWDLPQASTNEVSFRVSRSVESLALTLSSGTSSSGSLLL